jgi:hypothetical protein
MDDGSVQGVKLVAKLLHRWCQQTETALDTEQCCGHQLARIFLATMVAP